MNYNLFITYDLRGVNRDYSVIEKAITSLGAAVHTELSVWYLRTQYNGRTIADTLWKQMQSNDRLLVIDVTSQDAFSYGISDVMNRIAALWNV